LLVYICIALGDPVIKRGRFGIPLTGLTLPHFCAGHKPGSRYKQAIKTCTDLLPLKKTTYYHKNE
jgi:hypothetical protein